jgi:hypothetical protein
MEEEEVEGKRVHAVEDEFSYGLLYIYIYIYIYMHGMLELLLVSFWSLYMLT